jgi:hypothetical protein
MLCSELCSIRSASARDVPRISPQEVPLARVCVSGEPQPSDRYIVAGKGAAECIGRVLRSGFCASFLFAAPV